VKSFTERLKAFDDKVTPETGNFAFYSYDFVPMLVEAMKKAGTVDDPQKVVDALTTLTDDGVAGTVCFSQDERTAIYDGSRVFARDGKVESTAIKSAC
jgi:ABC-type branched-subunit amino acid transport system substrate-binding protein